MPQIHFAHGNGFPSPCYQQLFNVLEGEGFDISYLDMHGHQDYKVDEHWFSLVNELIHTLESNYQQPVIGLGHSLGGVLHSIAATLRPELYSGVIMLDSPLLARTDRFVLGLGKRLGLIDKMTPAGRSKGRRRHWADIAQAREYFCKRGLFKKFDPRCLEDYLREGLLSDANGVRLRYRPEIEMDIYRTLPHRLPANYLHFKVPIALLYGLESDLVTPRRVALAKRSGVRVASVQGSHMFPMEYPELCAQAVLAQIAEMGLMQGKEEVAV